MEIILIVVGIFTAVMIMGGIDNNRPVKDWSTEKLERMLPKLQRVSHGQKSSGNHEKAEEIDQKIAEIAGEMQRRKMLFSMLENSLQNGTDASGKAEKILVEVNWKSTNEIRKIQSCLRNCYMEEASSILADRVNIRYKQLKNLGYPNETAKERALFDALEIDHALAVHDWPYLDPVADFAEKSGILKNTEAELENLKKALEEEEAQKKNEGYSPIYDVHQRFSINSPELWLRPAVKKQWLDQLQKVGIVKIETSLRYTQSWCLSMYGCEYLWYGNVDAGELERALYVKPGKLAALKALLGEPDGVDEDAPGAITPMVGKSDEDVIDEILRLNEISRAELDELPWKDRKYKEITSEELDEMHAQFMADAHAARFAGNEELALSLMKNVGGLNSEFMIRRQIEVQRASEEPIDLADPDDESRLKFLLKEKMNNYLYKVQTEEMEFNYKNVVTNRVNELQRKYHDLGHEENDANLRAKCELIGVKLKS